MNRKYKFTDNTRYEEKHILYQIEALRDFGDVTKGTLGGFIECDYNLSHDGDCWVGKGVKVYGNARIDKNAFIGRNEEEELVICDGVFITGPIYIQGNGYINGDIGIYGLGKREAE